MLIRCFSDPCLLHWFHGVADLYKLPWFVLATLLFCGLFFAWHAVSGVITGQAVWFRRLRPDALVTYSEAPATFQLIVLFYAALAALTLSLVGFIVWTEREGRKNEERYFRQKSLLEPDAETLARRSRPNVDRKESN